MAGLHGKIQKKVVLLLLAGVALGLTRSPQRQWKILKEVADEWKEIDRRDIRRSIADLYRSKMLNNKENEDGTTTVLLNQKGKRLALTYNLDNMMLSKGTKWDGKWRMVMFDIPEKNRRSRDSFRFHLKRLEFFEYQKSVFVTPYRCAQEVEYLREFWHVKPFVRYVLADRLDNEIHLKNHFNLP